MNVEFEKMATDYFQITPELYQECLDLLWRHLKAPTASSPPGCPTRLYAEAAKAAINGRYAEARIAYEKAATGRPVEEDARAVCGTACTLALQDDLEGARQILRRIQPSAVASVEGLFDIAVLSRHLGLYEKALEAHANLQHLTTPDYRHFCEMAFLQARIGDFEAATTAAREAEAAAPATMPATRLLVAAYLCARQGREALRQMQATLTPSSSSEDWYVAVAQLADAKLPDEARNLASQALRAYPLDGMLHGLLGGILYGLQQWNGAVEAYERALHLLPNTPDEARWKSLLCTRLARALLRLERVLPASETLQKAVEFNPENGEAHYLLGSVLRALGREEEALASWKLAEGTGDAEGIECARSFLESGDLQSLHVGQSYE